MANPRVRDLRWLLVFAGIAVLLVLDYVFTPWLGSTRPEDWPRYRLLIDHGAHLAGDGLNLALVGVALWLVGAGWSLPRWRIAGRWVIWAVCLAGFWSQALKLTIGRPRPRQLLLHGYWAPKGPNITPSFDSFPSGHAMTVFAVTGLLSALFPRYRMALLVFAVAVSVGRVYGGDHFPSDILLGSLMGVQLGRYVAGRWAAEVADEAA
ncbi:MAG: phosphatase PAP2 family protein [Armatimonadetes bacterium]|nr:phosphatase PAP2 family protein [Armatimonadota bacterium]